MSRLLPGGTALAVFFALTSCPRPPSAVCTTSSDCREGEICVAGLCRTACNSVQQCRVGEICLDGYCQARVDAGAIDGARPDAEPVDAPRLDAAAMDWLQRDGEPADTAAGDRMTPDRPADAGSDSGESDAGDGDAGDGDAGESDAGSGDACAAPTGPPWWNDNYPWRAQIAISATPASYTLALDASDSEAARFDPSSLGTGDDLRVVWWDGASNREIDRALLAFSATRVTLHFRLQEPGGHAGGSESYFLYVGAGASTGNSPADNRKNVYLFFEDFEGMAVGSDGSPAFVTATLSHWRVEVEGSGNHVLTIAADDGNPIRMAGLTLTDVQLEMWVKFNSAYNSIAGVNFSIRGCNLLGNATYYSTTLQHASNRLGIGHTVNGAWQGFLETTSLEINLQQWYRLRSHAVGTKLNAVSGTASTTYLHAENGCGEIGINGFFSDVSVDDVMARMLVDPEPSVALGAWQERCQ
ncbi:MAG: hypothetical protein JXR83_10330 [Deltaproteobacteria bacterium]|nr:hypothetical protein [Deltaproteobacteria bacterium]